VTPTVGDVGSYYRCNSRGAVTNLSADKLLHLRPLPAVAIMAAVNKSLAQSNKTASGRFRYLKRC
jgi:hypothetical protein